MASAQFTATNSTLFLDGFRTNAARLFHGAKWVQHSNGARLEFNTPLQFAEASLTQSLDGIQEMSVGGWFFPRGNGEQYFIARGLPEVGAQGERFFRPSERFVDFLLGTDRRAFFLGTIHGNGWMPFPRVTVNEVAFDSWNELVVTKDAWAHHRF